MKISEQQFIWCRADCKLEDAQDIIKFLKPFCKNYFIGHHSKGESSKKPPHFHFYLTFLNISMNSLRAKFKKNFPGEMFISNKYNSQDLNNNKIISPAYILAKPFDVPHWHNDELDWQLINEKIEEIMNRKSKNTPNKSKTNSTERLNKWLNKLKTDNLSRS